MNDAGIAFGLFMVVMFGAIVINDFCEWMSWCG